MANILVVDDELGIRELLFEILNDEGHQVEVAENAAQARAARQNSRPDLVLLDIIMPEVDGFQVLETMKSNSTLADIPVIVVSAIEHIESVVKCIEMGAEDHLTKPFDPAFMQGELGARRQFAASMNRGSLVTFPSRPCGTSGEHE